tara:strand:- start:203 stop:2035 length:1833 start_codon:yes stop_codon:yes gene_type:complete
MDKDINKHVQYFYINEHFQIIGISVNDNDNGIVNCYPVGVYQYIKYIKKFKLLDDKIDSLINIHKIVKSNNKVNKFLKFNDYNHIVTDEFKRDKLEQNSYIMFINKLKLFLNNNPDKHKELYNLLKNNNPPWDYNAFKINLKDNYLKPYLTDEIIWVDEINIGLDDLYNYLDNENDDNNTFFTTNNKLVLPKINQLNGENNEEFYFLKLSDQLIRYDNIRKFIFKVHRYLSYDNQETIYNNNEIILTKDMLMLKIDNYDKNYNQPSNRLNLELLSSQRSIDAINLDFKDSLFNWRGIKFSGLFKQSRYIKSKNDYVYNVLYDYIHLYYKHLNKSIIVNKFDGKYKYTVKSYDKLLDDDDILNKHDIKYFLIAQFINIKPDVLFKLLKTQYNVKHKVNDIDNISIELLHNRLINNIINDTYTLSILDIYLIFKLFNLPCLIILDNGDAMPYTPTKPMHGMQVLNDYTHDNDILTSYKLNNKHKHYDYKKYINKNNNAIDFKIRKNIDSDYILYKTIKLSKYNDIKYNIKEIYTGNFMPNDNIMILSVSNRYNNILVNKIYYQVIEKVSLNIPYNIFKSNLLKGLKFSDNLFILDIDNNYYFKSKKLINVFI